MCENIVGGNCGVVGLLSNKELDVLESERVVGGICSALAILAGLEEEEEGNLGEVADGDVSWVGSLVRSIQGLGIVNQEVLHSCWRRIFFMTTRRC